MEPRPSRVLRSVVVIAIAGAFAACQSAVAPSAALAPSNPSAPAAATSPAAAPPSVAPEQIPPLADIPTYKATPGRTGVNPGPGPVSEPVEVWSHSVECLVGNRTPALASGLLLLTCDAPKLVALDARTGEVRWTAELAGSGLLTPSVADGVAYVGTSGKTFDAIELATGKSRWSVPLDTIRWSAIADGRVYVGVTDGRYVGLDPADGSIDWTWTSPIADDDLVGTVLDGTAYLSGTSNWLYAVNLADASTAWSIRGTADRFTVPAVTDDSVVVGSQPVAPMVAFDRATGKERWRYSGESGDQVAPASIADGIVYAPSTSDGFFAFDVASGDVLWRADTGTVDGQAPAIVGSVVYVTADRDVQAYDRTTGKHLWSVDLKGDADNSSLVSGGMLFTSDNNGMVRAFAEPALATLIASGPAVSPAVSPAASGPSIVALESTFDATTTPGLDQPSGLDVGPDGNLYLVSALTDEILVLDPADGSVIRRWGKRGSNPGEFNFLREPQEPASAIGGIAVAAGGTVYVADTVNRRVQAFSPTGEFIRTWGRFGQGDGQFLEPIDVAVDPKGDVYVVDDQRDDIQRFSSDGTYRSTIGRHGTGPGEMSFTGGIDVGADGTLYNADYDNDRVQAWDPSGSFLWTTGPDGSGSAGFNEPADVTSADGGLLFVTDTGRLQALDADRNVVATFPLSQIEQITLASDGPHVYVAEGFVDTVRKLRIVR